VLADEVESETRSRAAVAAPLARGLNVNKRAEALRLVRRGADAQTLVARLGISSAEALLLLKLDRTLSAQPAPQPVKSPQERSRSLEYSLEA
jgi:hypothetical protein